MILERRVDTSSIPGGYIGSLLNSLRQRNIAIGDLLQDCGIDRDADGNPLLPKQVPVSLYTQVYKFYLEHMHGEHFALSGQGGHTAGKYQMMTLLLAQSDTLGAGLNKAREFYASFGSSMDSFVLEPSQGTVHLRLTHPLKVSATLRPVIGANLLIAIKRTCELLVGQELPLRRVDLQGKAPARPERYETLFGSKVQFGKSADAMVFDVNILELPIVHTPESVSAMIDDIPGRLFTTPIGNNKSIAERVRALLGHDFSRGIPSQQAVAQRLGLSASALRRNLAREGSSYQALKKELRLHRARQLLADENLSLADVATQLGFPAASAMHRAFKKWTGLTPGEYRATLTDEDAF